MVDNAGNFRTHIALLCVQNVVIDKSHIFDFASVRELSSELIVEVKVIQTDLAILQMSCDLQVAEEVSFVAVDNWNPLLAQLLLVVECKHKCTDS